MIIISKPSKGKDYFLFIKANAFIQTKTVHNNLYTMKSTPGLLGVKSAPSGVDACSHNRIRMLQKE